MKKTKKRSFYHCKRITDNPDLIQWNLLTEDDQEFLETSINDNFPSQYVVLIKATDYEKCRKYLENRENTVYFYELYGRYDFIAKYLSEKDDFVSNNPTIKETSSEIKVLEIRNVKIWEGNRGFTILEGKQKENRYYYSNKLNILDFFIYLTPREKRINEDQVENLLKALTRKLKLDCNKIADEIIYRVFELNGAVVLLHLLVNCWNINKVNQFTTAVDNVVDRCKYEKNTFISTKSDPVGGEKNGSKILGGGNVVLVKVK